MLNNVKYAASFNDYLGGSLPLFHARLIKKKKIVHGWPIWWYVNYAWTRKPKVKNVQHYRILLTEFLRVKTVEFVIDLINNILIVASPKRSYIRKRPYIGLFPLLKTIGFDRLSWGLTWIRLVEHGFFNAKPKIAHGNDVTSVRAITCAHETEICRPPISLDNSVVFSTPGF